MGEIRDHLHSYSLDQLDEINSVINKQKTVLRKHQALLYWNNHLQNQKLWSDQNKANLYKLYCSETVSDVAQTFILSTQGLYKPALLLLRSSIENHIKSIGIHQDQKILSLKSTFEIFNVVKGTPVVNLAEPMKTTFGKLRSEYTNLCEHVHSADIKHMSLTKFLGEYPRYEDPRLTEVNSVALKVLSAFLTTLPHLHSKELKKIHYLQRDFILDNLTKPLKRSLSDAGFI